MKAQIKQKVSKLVPTIILILAVVIIGYVLSYRSDTLGFYVTNNDQIQLCKKLYEAEHKDADVRFAERFVSPIPSTK